MTKIELNRVHYMPTELSPGVLYVSEEFKIAGHLCPCGCGSKIMTPLGPTEWSFTAEEDRATLYPSLGNWQLPCRSHYWIVDGEIEWSYQWSDKQIKAGQEAEERRRKSYFEKVNSKRKRKRSINHFIKWILGKAD